MSNFREIYTRHWRYGYAILIGGFVGRLVYYLGEQAYVTYKLQPMTNIDALSISVWIISGFAGIATTIGLYKWFTEPPR